MSSSAGGSGSAGWVCGRFVEVVFVAASWAAIFSRMRSARLMP